MSIPKGKGHTNMKNQKFGIEIEMTGITRQQAANKLAQHWGTRPNSGSNDTVLDPQGRQWKLEYDGSIITRKKVGGALVGADSEYSVELVSPILTYEDIPLLQEAVRQFRHIGAVSSAELKCGIHIHINAEPHTPQSLRNIVNLITAKEDLVYKSLQIDPERTRRYCQKVNGNLVEIINRQKPRTMAKLADIWYRANGAISNRSWHYNPSRYHGLNLHSVFTKGTIEFRLFNGTLHAGKIRAYIVFCLAVSHQALRQKYASPRKSQMDNEKYAFRCWLLRLGLIGDEFKNCREHLMAHLSGDSAWRHGA